MKLIGKLIILIIIVGILLGASAYIIFYTNDTTDNGNGQQEDTEPPQITDIPGDLTITAGQTVTITVLFTDNINVTEATLYYKPASSTSWLSKSILSGSATILIPSSATSNYYYYITVDDAAGNGPVGDPSVDGSDYYIITVQPGNGNQDNETFTHTVFVEEATATWCTNCPNVANILHDLYESHDYDFYYVSLINDTNQVAANRNWNDYHLYGFPTVFIDGGYRVILGGNKPESDYANAIVASQERTVPKIKVTLTAQYKNTTGEVAVNAVIKNGENTSYTGRLKLYLTEIVSHVTGYDSKPYHYAFLEYLTDEEISVNGNSEATVTKTTDISAYDFENLMIIGVVFSSDKEQGYANPLNTTANLFDAYYADATDATRVVEGGNLPPILEITSPQKGKIYRNKNYGFLQLFSERTRRLKLLENVTIIKNLMYNKTLILGFGKIPITVNASDDSAVTKVEFYIDGTLYFNDTEAPYEWTITRISKFIPSLIKNEHTLKVVVYDDIGKTNSAQLVFKARI